jgi:hypothetical protein
MVTMSAYILSPFERSNIQKIINKKNLIFIYLVST